MVNIMLIFLSIFVILSFIFFHLRHESKMRRIFHKMQTLRDELLEQTEGLERKSKGNVEILKESIISLIERVSKMEENRSLDTVKLDSLTQNIKELSHLFGNFQYEMRYDLFLSYTLQLAEEAKAKGFINKDNYEKFAQIIHEIKVDKYSQSLGH